MTVETEKKPSGEAQATASGPFIVCDNLVKIYKVAELEVMALQGLDLVVQAGELMAIVGASGSGKTTLMNVLGGLDRPSAGRAWVNGKDLLKLSNAELNQYRRSEVGFVWQHGARNLIPYLDAFENVKLPMTLAGQAGRGVNRRARDLLEVVGLGDRLHHKLSELSGGEQQRVAIAVALANNPKLLLADEPTGELDSATALTIYDLLNNLNREFGLTTLIVSHDPSIARHVHRVVAIRDGKLASETVRARANGGGAAPSGDSTEDEAYQAEEVFEELTVLDSAGRLQIPKEYLEFFNIRGRARLEITEDGILVLPAGAHVDLDHVQDAEALVTGFVEARKARGLSGLFNRLVRGERRRDGGK